MSRRYDLGSDDGLSYGCRTQVAQGTWSCSRTHRCSVHLEAGRAYRDGADELLVVESSIFMPVSLTKYPAGYKWLVRRGVERMFINVRDGAPLPNWMLLPALRC
jgi:hypothetical protein